VSAKTLGRLAIYLTIVFLVSALGAVAIGSFKADRLIIGILEGWAYCLSFQALGFGKWNA
jgi:hypothetical protein